MPSAWVVEAVDVLKERGFCFATRDPCVPPDQLGLQGFEEGLYGGIIVAVSLSAHRDLKSLLARAFLIVMATGIGVVNTSRRRLAQVDRHAECADRKVLLHPVADRPADNAP